MTLLYCRRTVRSIHQKFFLKKLFLKILQYPLETHLCWSFFNKVAGLRVCNFIKKSPGTGVFMHEVFNTTLLKNICKQPLFEFSNGSLLNGSKGSRSRLYDGVRLQGPSHRSSFLFLISRPVASPKLYSNT